jgi:hypothetical protein
MINREVAAVIRMIKENPGCFRTRFMSLRIKKNLNIDLFIYLSIPKWDRIT